MPRYQHAVLHSTVLLLLDGVAAIILVDPARDQRHLAQGDTQRHPAFDRALPAQTPHQPPQCRPDIEKDCAK